MRFFLSNLQSNCRFVRKHIWIRNLAARKKQIPLILIFSLKLQHMNPRQLCPFAFLPVAFLPVAFYLLPILPVAVLPFGMVAQTAPSKYTIEGRVLDKKSSTPIAYASIYNQTTGKGTISNDEGYFKLEGQAPPDSVFVSFVGYERAVLPLQNRARFFEVYLEENAQLLGEVTVVADNQAWLYDLLAACKSKASKAKMTAKAYYGLKSFADGHQVELVECFYNSRLEGYDLEELSLKTGRIAVQPWNRRFFVSKESWRAILMLKVFDENEYFPKSPLELSRRELKKAYYLDVSKKYRDENRDSILVLDFVPKDTLGGFFKGQIWVNFSQKHVLKINLECADATVHPFLPLFGIDNIQKVDLQFTKTFETIRGQTFFKHIDFAYQVTYKSRDAKTYAIATSAVLYAYDFGKSFLLPKFDFAFEKLDDYRKISAIPYNAFFWKHNEEWRLNDQRNENEAFFTHPESMTNETAFSPNRYFKYGFLEHPYRLWSRERIRLSEAVPPEGADTRPLLEKPYELSVKLFLDVNLYSDTLQYVTATLIDPYESHYRLPMTDTALCFINLYFDLVEMERRNLETAIRQSDKSVKTFEKLYEASYANMEQRKQQYFKEVERGENKKAMQQWNAQVLERLGIDNIAIFKLYNRQ